MLTAFIIIPISFEKLSNLIFYGPYKMLFKKKVAINNLVATKYNLIFFLSVFINNFNWQNQKYLPS